MEKRIVAEDVCLGMAIKNNNTQDYNHINQYEDFDISEVKVDSNGKKIISIGDFEKESCLDFMINFEDLYNERLKNIDKINDCEIEFINIIFKGFSLNNKNYFSYSLKFGKCIFPSHIHFGEKVYEEKIGFYNCDIKSLSSDNSTFNKLFEIYNCEIKGDFNFRKVDFKDNVVFTRSKFRSKFIIYYTTFYKLAIFSRAIFKNNKGYLPFDISQCIIKQDLIFFGTDVGNYKATFVNFNSQYYDKAMESGNYVPQQNKRETFRIIKQQLVQQDNLIEAEKYAKLEKLSYWEELCKTRNYRKFSSFISLFLNRVSNNYKTSFLVAFLFIIIVSNICHLILQISDVYEYTAKNYIKLLNPTDLDFYNRKEATSGKLYLAYFLSKVFIGYGIYQFIQAFRKFR